PRPATHFDSIAPPPLPGGVILASDRCLFGLDLAGVAHPAVEFSPLDGPAAQLATIAVGIGRHPSVQSESSANIRTAAARSLAVGSKRPGRGRMPAPNEAVGRAVLRAGLTLRDGIVMIRDMAGAPG